MEFPSNNWDSEKPSETSKDSKTPAKSFRPPSLISLIRGEPAKESSSIFGKEQPAPVVVQIPLGEALRSQKEAQAASAEKTTPEVEKEEFPEVEHQPIMVAEEHVDATQPDVWESVNLPVGISEDLETVETDQPVPTAEVYYPTPVESDILASAEGTPTDVLPTEKAEFKEEKPESVKPVEPLFTPVEVVPEEKPPAEKPQTIIPRRRMGLGNYYGGTLTYADKLRIAEEEKRRQGMSTAAAALGVQQYFEKRRAKKAIQPAERPKTHPEASREETPKPPTETRATEVVRPMAGNVLRETVVIPTELRVVSEERRAETPTVKPQIEREKPQPERQEPLTDVDAFERKAGQHIKQSEWLSYAVDERGKEIPDAINYGEEFYKERDHEQSQKQFSEATDKAGAVVQDLGGTSAPMLSSGQVPNDHDLPAGQPTHQDPQHLLAAKNGQKNNLLVGGIWLWTMLMIILVVFLIASN